MMTSLHARGSLMSELLSHLLMIGSDLRLYSWMLCMLREALKQLCPAYQSGAALQRDMAALKSGQLHVLCLDAIYAFYDVRTSTLPYKLVNDSS